MDNQMDTKIANGILGIIFATLKLTEHIDWAWGWVLAPFWMPPAIIIFIELVDFTLSKILKK